MNIRVMKTFCDLVDTGSFSRAAKINSVTQSAVSQQISKLEHELSAELIRRSAGLTVATDAGMAFYRGAKDILSRYDQLQEEIKTATTSVRGVLRVGSIYSVGFSLLNPFICTFLREHPEVNLHVEYTHWNRINAAVLNNEMDLGIVAYPEKHRSIEIIPFATEELVLVCSPEHPLANKKSVTPSDMKGQDFVAFEEHIPTRHYIDREIKRHRVKVNITMEFDNIELLKRAIEINAGISILPYDNIEREVYEKRLCYAPFRRPEGWGREIGIIRNRAKAPSRAEKMFLRLLRKGSPESA